jgi:septum formation topological specificity factor MinE
MPLSSSNVSALKRIAELAGSAESADERLRHVLAAAREALGLDALSVVVTGGAVDDLQSWHATTGEPIANSSAVEEAALEAISGAGKQKTAKGRVVVPIPTVNGFRGAIVGQGAGCTDAEVALLEVVSTYVTLLVENLKLSAAADKSNQLNHRKLEEIAALHEIGQAIEAKGPAHLLDLIVKKAAAVWTGRRAL